MTLYRGTHRFLILCINFMFLCWRPIYTMMFLCWRPIYTMMFLCWRPIYTMMYFVVYFTWNVFDMYSATIYLLFSIKRLFLKLKLFLYLWLCMYKNDRPTTLNLYNTEQTLSVHIGSRHDVCMDTWLHMLQLNKSG